jgi:hypothetical protein
MYTHETNATDVQLVEGRALAHVLTPPAVGVVHDRHLTTLRKQRIGHVRAYEPGAPVTRPFMPSQNFPRDPLAKRHREGTRYRRTSFSLAPPGIRG